MPTDPAREFWDWFGASADVILAALDEGATNPDSKKVLRDLNRRLLRIDSSLSWEIGPFLGDTTFLAISPNGKRDYLDHTRRIVELAPSVPGWRFLPAKPPKNEKRFNFDFGGVRVDTSKWRYSLSRWENPIQYGVTWLPDSGASLDGVSPEELAWFVLESEIGEEAAISLFDFSEIDHEEDTKATDIKHFRDHFSDLRRADTE